MQFDTLTLKNFLSFGNQAQSINLNTGKTLQLTGLNGAGKSTIASAISFVLFGKTVKNLKKSEIPNNINKKDCVVTLTFQKGGSSYKVLRGINPSRFEIYRDDVLVNQSSTVMDYQYILERDILGYSQELFKQIVVLSGSHFTPFFGMTLKNRRLVLEELLSLQEITKMENMLKVYQSNNNALRREQTTLLNELSSNITRQNTLLEEAKVSTFSKNAEVLKLIENRKEVRDKLERSKTTLSATIADSLDPMARVMDNLSTLSTLIADNKTSIDNIQGVIHHKEETIQFLEQSDACSTCGQELTDEYKAISTKKVADEIDELQSSQNGMNSTSLSLTLALEKVTEKVEEHRSQNAAFAEISSQIDSINSSIEQLSSTLIKETDESSRECGLLEEIKVLGTRYQQLQGEFQESSTEFEVYQKAKDILSDDGVRKVIIKKYIPFIQKRINYWLGKLDLFAKVTFDNDFQEEIKMRGFDKIRFESCSQGEQARLTLSSVLAFRELMDIRNNEISNLLILDEIVENIAYEGKLRLIKSVRSISQESGISVFVVSHSNLDEDVFDGEVKCSKQGNFSIIKQE